MFKNISGKIKTLAQTICWIGIIISVIVGLYIFITTIIKSNNAAIIVTGSLTGILYLIIGPILSWVGSFLMYGFGELIEKTCKIAQNTSSNTK